MLELVALIKQAEQLATPPCERGAHTWVSYGASGFRGTYQSRI